MPNGHYNWNELTRDEKERILEAWREDTKTAFADWFELNMLSHREPLLIQHLELAFIAGAEYARGGKK